MQQRDAAPNSMLKSCIRLFVNLHDPVIASSPMSLCTIIALCFVVCVCVSTLLNSHRNSNKIGIAIAFVGISRINSRSMCTFICICNSFPHKCECISLQRGFYVKSFTILSRIQRTPTSPLVQNTKKRQL